jgi:hypothetical protein
MLGCVLQHNFVYKNNTIPSSRHALTYKFVNTVVQTTYIYIYILYITSPELPITRGSPGQTVQSGRAEPGPSVYKRRPEVLGFSFSCPSRFISDNAHPNACDGRVGVLGPTAHPGLPLKVFLGVERCHQL